MTLGADSVAKQWSEGVEVENISWREEVEGEAD